MKKSTIIIVLFFAFAIFIFIQPNPARFDYLKGQYGIDKFLYKNKPINNLRDKVLLIDNLSSWINIGDIYNDKVDKNEILIGKYKFEDTNGKISMIITNSKTPYLNGKYNVKIDTLEYNEKFHNFKMTFSSNQVSIVGLKSTTYLNF